MTLPPTAGPHPTLVLLHGSDRSGKEDRYYAEHAQGDFSPERVDHFASLVADSDTWITPTLIISHKILAIFDDLDTELSRPEMEFLHPMIKGIWDYLLKNMYLTMPPEHQGYIHRGFESFQLPFTKALHEKGVKLMAGTDVLIPTIFPGYSIHEELSELVQIGLTPYEALKSSTSHPMEYLGELDDAGTLEIGKRADLVLLSTNPLENITNLRRIDGVMFKEKWLDRENIQSRMNEMSV